MVPGNTVCGHRSFWAGAPSMTGGTFRKLSSSLGNLKPASLNALPKSLSLGKSRWQVVQEVPYWRENAGIACPVPLKPISVVNNRPTTRIALRERMSSAPSMLKFKYFAPDSFPKMGRILVTALERLQGGKSRLNVIEITISEVRGTTDP